MNAELRYRWDCLECPEKGEGTNAEVDKAAEKHTKTTCHSTVCGLYPAQPDKTKDVA